MLKKKLTLVACALSLATISHAYAFDWVDDELSYTYQPWTKNPSVQQGIPTHTFTFTHVDGWTYGTNFINISGTKWGAKDRVNSAGSFSGDGEGAQSVFAVGRFAFSGNKIFNTNALSYGPLTDISLDTGGNWGVHNDTFASETRAFVIGPQFSFDLPEKGFANFAVHYYKEWNHDAFAVGPAQEESFDPTYNLELGWSQPIPVGIPGFAFKGFYSLTGPKGTDGEGHKTKPETYLHVKLVVDAGDILFNIPKKLEAGVGFEYWYNIFGDDHKLQTGNIEHTPFFTVTYKF
jgi:hypothetical protein